MCHTDNKQLISNINIVRFDRRARGKRPSKQSGQTYKVAGNTGIILKCLLKSLSKDVIKGCKLTPAQKGHKKRDEGRLLQ